MAAGLNELLGFISQKAIAGEMAEVNEYLIAFEIYGGDDAVRIRLPLESYVPVFETAPSPAASPESPVTAVRRTPFRSTLAVTLATVTTMAALVPLSRRATDPRSSIAVLPFTNEGDLSDKDYFSDGLTEQIANRLGRTGKMQVAAGRSAERFRDNGGDVRRIGRDLHVDLVLEGSVRFAGERIGVATRMYNTQNGRPI